MATSHKDMQKLHKAAQKKLAGEVERNAGVNAYNATTGIHGFWATLDRAQAYVTHAPITPEGQQIHKGERLTMEAEALESSVANPNM